MSIKLICIDMDGTLLKDQQIVSEENKKAIKEAIEKGVKVAITTGRMYDCAKLYSKEIGLDTPIIASNGAFIGYKDEVIYNNPLSISNIKAFLDVTKKYNLNSYVTANFGIISDYELPETHVYKVLNKTLNEDERIKLLVTNDMNKAMEEYNGQILKGVCVDGQHIDELVKARKELEDLNMDVEIVSSWDDNFEIMKKGSSKGEAVKALTEYLGLKQDEVMCIGDSENDLSMIKYAGVGVAMGNAIEKVKKSADYITDTNVNDGVAKAIRKFVI